MNLYKLINELVCKTWNVTPRSYEELNLERTKLERDKLRLVQVISKLWVLINFQTTITFITWWVRCLVRYQIELPWVLFLMPLSLLNFEFGWGRYVCLSAVCLVTAIHPF